MPHLPLKAGAPTFYLDQSTLSDAYIAWCPGLDPKHERIYRPLRPWIERIANEANLCLSLAHLRELSRWQKTWGKTKLAHAMCDWLNQLPTRWLPPKQRCCGEDLLPPEYLSDPLWRAIAKTPEEIAAALVRAVLDQAAMPAWHVETAIMRGYTVAAGRRKPGSSSERKLWVSGLYDYVHAAAAAYCDVLTCDKETSLWLGDVRENFGRTRQLSAGTLKPAVFVEQLLATYP